MIESDQVRTDWMADGVLRVTFDRPAKRNAFTPAMVAALHRIIDRSASAKEVRALVLTGAGGVFSAGADLTEFAIGGDHASDFLRRGNRMTAALAALRKPVVAAVDGLALGGGFEVALACSFRVASECAVFGLPEITLGLIPAWRGVPNLVRTCGPSKALNVCLAAERLSAADAQSLGLLHRVVPAGDLENAASELAIRLAGWSSQAVAAILELAAAANASWEREAELFEDALKQPEAIAALARFVKKRAA